MTDRILVYGPPGAGKSTFAKRLKAQGYVWLERELFIYDQAFRYAVKTSDAERLVVVRCCFSARELREWMTLAGATRVVKVDPGIEDVKRRLHARGHSQWRGEIASAERWYRSWAQGGKDSRRPRRVKTKTTTEQGYGRKHQNARKQWEAVVESGGAYCTRCRRPIYPGSAWHLDHSENRRYYLGVAHAKCNMRAGGRRGATITNGVKRAKRRVSRAW